MRLSSAEMRPRSTASLLRVAARLPCRCEIFASTWRFLATSSPSAGAASANSRRNATTVRLVTEVRFGTPPSYSCALSASRAWRASAGEPDQVHQRLDQHLEVDVLALLLVEDDVGVLCAQPVGVDADLLRGVTGEVVVDAAADRAVLAA